MLIAFKHMIRTNVLRLRWKSNQWFERAMHNFFDICNCSLTELRLNLLEAILRHRQGIGHIVETKITTMKCNKKAVKHEDRKEKEVDEGWEGGQWINLFDRRGAASLDEKPDTAWLTFGAEFLGLKEDQFKRAFDRSAKALKCEELGARNTRRATHFRC